jgi:hypothetical protein
LKGFRDVMAESDEIGAASASASQSAREARDAFTALPPRGEPERIEPRFGQEVEETEREAQRRQRREAKQQEGQQQQERQQQQQQQRQPQPVMPPPPEHFAERFEDEAAEPPPVRSGSIVRKLVAVIALLLLAGLAFLLYREWPTVAGMFQTARAPTQSAPESPAIRPKISDRIGGTQQEPATRASPSAPAAVAQRVVLYEQQPNTQERKQYVGSVIWKNEMTSPSPGQPSDIAIRGEVEIPDRHMRMGFTVRRNLDQSLPASHTIEVLFSTPADFAPGGIADVPGVLMEDTEQNRGAPLTGLRVKVTTGFFLIGLSSVEADVRRNLQLIKERPWLHIPIVYNNGQRALLAMEKGVPGDKVFEEALRVWGQAPTAAR